MDANTEADLRRRLANQAATIQEDDRALMAAGARLRETEERLAAALRRLDRIANALQVVRDARCARSSQPNSTTPTPP